MDKVKIKAYVGAQSKTNEEIVKAIETALEQRQCGIDMAIDQGAILNGLKKVLVERHFHGKVGDVVLFREDENQSL
jgi:hypothetical protein